MSASVEVVGVRHHSPACARLVEATIRRVRPAYVLVEGPADFNGRLSELLLPHTLPVAIFSYASGEGRHHASWSPFCEYSPEQVALRVATEVGAEARFMDLPAWDPALREVDNRYADRHLRAPSRWEQLALRFGVDDTDALWDLLFEQPLAPDALSARLRPFFAELRGDDGEAPDERDRRREAYMARCLAWAAARGQPVVAVCGGFHAPRLERAWKEVPAAEAVWPEPPGLEPGARGGSYVVPYSFHRLDAFVGYEAGMPSPAYYQAAWELGPAAAPEALLGATLTALRGRKQLVSPADALAAWAQAEGLARLRGHACVLRGDLLDGLASALVKDALDAPLPWSRRGPLRKGTDPLLVGIVAAFSGDRVGRLAPGTPRPPLVDDVAAELEAHGLEVGRTSRVVTLALPARLDASRVLHRLRVLGIPGVRRDAGPVWATDPILEEEWTLGGAPLERDAALIEAAAYGSSLASAATAKVEEALVGAEGKLSLLSRALGDAIFIGIDRLAAKVVAAVGKAIGASPSLAELGEALDRLLGLWGHDALYGGARAPALGAVIAAAFDRGLLLVERADVPEAKVPPEDVKAVVALRDALRDAGGALWLDGLRFTAVLDRRAASGDTPPAIQGAALGALWSLRLLHDEAEARAARVVKRAARPSTLGELLGGLFALAREEATAAPGLVHAIDLAIGSFDGEEFLIALPSLRLAFGWFPPAEKERLARALLARRGRDPLAARAALALDVDPLVVARGLALDAAVVRRRRRFGLTFGVEGA
jgi:hypothetical protein